MKKLIGLFFLIAFAVLTAATNSRAATDGIIEIPEFSTLASFFLLIGLMGYFYYKRPM